MKKKVLVGMSGGIDSSVAAYLLKKEGYEVEGITMLIWRPDSPYPVPMGSNSCYNPKKEEDLEETREICRKIGIPHHTVDCSDLYESTVLANFRSEYMSGRTPNPCIWCNTLVKFGAMVDYARTMIDFDYFATGHYARIVKEENGRYAIQKAVDQKKDQSYFLSRLTQKQLSSTLFPLGGLLKSEVRKIDVEQGFHLVDQTESQDFYGGDYADLLEQKDRKGNIILLDEGDKVVGQHNGFWHYTIGQRRGLGVAYSQPLFVVSLDPETNTVRIGTEKYIKGTQVSCLQPNWMGAEDVDPDTLYTVKIRSASPGVPAYVRKTADGFDVSFPTPVKAATPGQSAVVYDGDRVVASGVIESSK